MPTGDIPPPSSTLPQCASSRYQLVNETKSWQSARDYCIQNMTADLLSIETDDEFYYIRNKIQPSEQDWWVGLSRLRDIGGRFLLIFNALHNGFDTIFKDWKIFSFAKEINSALTNAC